MVKRRKLSKNDRKRGSRHVVELGRFKTTGLNNELASFSAEVQCDELEQDMKKDKNILKELHLDSLQSTSRKRKRVLGNPSYDPNVPRQMIKEQEYEEFLQDHQQYYSKLTRRTNLQESKTMDAPSHTTTESVSIITQNPQVHHIIIRGVSKQFDESSFKKIINEPIENLRLRIGKFHITTFVCFGDASRDTILKFNNQKHYGSKWQVHERKTDQSFSGTTRAIYVGNLPPDSTPSSIGGFFLRFGKIKYLTVVPLKSCAFIRFKHRQSVKTALEQVNGYQFHGYFLRVSEEKNVDDLSLEKFNEGMINLEDKLENA